MSTAFRRPFFLLLGAALCAASMWLYLQRVLIPYQIADSAAHGRPRGNLSDLYPRWIGARELLLHGRDPYSPEVTREIQAGYYGRVLDPSRSGDPKDQQGFVYPVYVVFYLAPTVHLPFPAVQRAFFWILVGLTVFSIPVWLRVLRWPLPLWAQLCIMTLTLGSIAAMQGLKLQQLSLFEAPLLAAAVLLLVADHAAIAGVLLALATAKPQLVWLLLLCLLVWTAGDWRRRWRWLASFLITLAILSAASEWLLPHWIPRFLQALRDYRNYTGSVSVVEELIPTPWSWLLELLALGAMVQACWRARRQPADAIAFVQMVCLTLAVTVLILPAYAPYNQLLLIPSILMLARQRRAIWRENPATRVLLILTAGILVWPWPATAMLAGLSYTVPTHQLQRFWAIPFWTSLPLPVGVAALMLVYTHRESFLHSAGQPTA